MKVFKKVLIVTGIIIALAAAAIIYFVVSDLKQEEVLKQEIINLTNKDLSSDDFDVTIKTTGDYAYVEEAIKKYYKELSDNIKEINKYSYDEEFTNILSADNLQSDRNGFIKSRKLVNDAKTKIIGSIENISRLCDEETIKSLLDKEKVDEYYINLYNKLMYTKDDLKELEKTKNEMEQTSKYLTDFLNKVLEILDFLDKNNSSWFVENGKLYLESDNLVEEYNKLYRELQAMADSYAKENKKVESKSNSV